MIREVGGGVDKIFDERREPDLSPCGRESNFNTLDKPKAQAKC
jgi:hypothetical protein